MLKTASLLVLLVVLPVWGRSRFAGKWPFERAIEDEVTPHCEKDGVKYKVDEEVPNSDPCVTCKCTQGGFVACVSVICMFPTCVDYEDKPDVCCQSCLNGKNCWHNKKLLQGDALLVWEEVEGDPLCQQACRCPGQVAYWRTGKNTQAMCFVRCA